MSDPAHEWDAGAYHAVSDPQFAWGEQMLAGLALVGRERVLDAGCGSGRLTSLLARRLPAGHVLGVDLSENMVREARRTLAGVAARCDLLRADLTALPFSGCMDVIFSTATFHWIRDHEALFASLYRALRPGGRLVAQLGGAYNLARLRMRLHDLTRSKRFAEYFLDWPTPWEMPDEATTVERLQRAGFAEVATGVQAAPIVLRDASSYAEFISTVVIRAHLGRLSSAELREAFVGALVDQAHAETPRFLLDYSRLNLSARKPTA